MNRAQLHALLRKASELSGHEEFVIVGSLSILGAVSDPPDAMVMSIDVDAYMKADPGRTGDLCDALGQGSPLPGPGLAQSALVSARVAGSTDAD